MYLVVFPNRESAVGSLTGVLASTVSILVAHPIEAVKVRLQSGERGGLIAASGCRWRQAASLLRRPYCGIGPHLVQYSALNFIRFGTYAAAKSYFEGRRAAAAAEAGAPPCAGPLPLTDIFLSGTFSGVCIAAVLHPLWVLKTHQQANRLGVGEAATRLWQGEGVRGFFRGYVSGFARFPLALGVFFSSWEALKRLTMQQPQPKAGASPRAGASGEETTLLCGSPADKAIRLAGLVGSGGLAGVLCWTSIFPLDVVQSRMIGEPVYGGGRVYSSALGAFRHIYATEGLRSFTRGYSAVLLRSGPVNAVMLDRKSVV